MLASRTLANMNLLWSYRGLTAAAQDTEKSSPNRGVALAEAREGGLCVWPTAKETVKNSAGADL
jgi:hypothetical protein